MVVVLGMAGSGKSTLCKALEQTENFRWVSMSDMLRRHATPKILDDIAHGEIVSSDALLPILKKEVRVLVGGPEVLIDGCPRTIDQAQAFVQDSSLITRYVAHLQIDEEVAIVRLLERKRFDDTPDAIRRRVDEYYAEITDILSLFEVAGVKVVHIDATLSPKHVVDLAKKALIP